MKLLLCKNISRLGIVGDIVLVEVRLAPELSSSIKLWVVREKTDDGDDEDETGREAGEHDDGADE